MKILSIGNSFSQDAQRYLHAIAKANSEEIKCINLFIGGCTLRQHYLNIIDDERKYRFEFNGENTGLMVSVREVLKSDNWDVITLQQGSHESFNFENYTPYIEYVAEYVKKYSPKSKILLHKTWAYPDNRKRLFEVGYKTTAEMFADVDKAYKKAFSAIKADGMTLSGNAMLTAYEKNKEIVYRDEIHASLGFGRYMIGLVWFLTLFEHKKVVKHIDEFDEALTEDEKELALEIACEATEHCLFNL